jgi:hypothetical protein
VKTDFPEDFHRAVYNRMEAVLEKSGNPGNNLLPRIPEIQDVLDHPAVGGALTGILGSSYYIHPHRYCHVNPPGVPEQHLHKDGWAKRHHRTRWGMGFYYPQDTPMEMGPTGVVPGSQYFNAGPRDGREIPLTGQAGTVVLVHYDLWHRGKFNAGDRTRFMIKFLFTRIEEPETPSWRLENAAWPETDHPLDGLWRSVWNWYRGQPQPPASREDDIRYWVSKLEDADETTQFQAAYALSGMGEKTVETLTGTLRSDDETLRRNAGYALTAIGDNAVDALTDMIRARRTSEASRASALDTLGDIGIPANRATAVVADALEDASVETRRAAAAALGTMRGSAAERLGKALDDEDDWVCRNAALALLRLGPHAEPAEATLINGLRHRNRYVRWKAARSLERIGSSRSLEAALDFYRTSAWCSITDTGAPF